MIAEYRRKANIALLLYFVFKIAAIGWAIAAGEDTPVNTSIFWMIFLTGTAFAFRACWAQGRAKGYGGSLVLLGLLGFWGFIIVALLVDKARNGVVTTPPRAGSTASGAPA